MGDEVEVACHYVQECWGQEREKFRDLLLSICRGLWVEVSIEIEHQAFVREGICDLGSVIRRVVCVEAPSLLNCFKLEDGEEASSLFGFVRVNGDCLVFV